MPAAAQPLFLPWHHWLLGQPWPLLLLLLILLVLAALLWRQFRGRLWGGLALGLAGTWILSWALAFWVDTEGEKLEARTAEVVWKADLGQWAGVEPALAPGAELTDGAVRVDLRSFRGMVEGRTRSPGPGWRVVQLKCIGWDGQRGRVRLGLAEDGGRGGMVTVEVDWSIERKPYFINEIEIVGVPGGQPVGALRGWSPGPRRQNP